MSKESLTADQLKQAKQLDKALKELSKIKESLADYKLDNIYILEGRSLESPEVTEIDKTHMGFPTKFKVVYISPEGVPYLRKITSAGNPTGESLIPFEAETLHTLRNHAAYKRDWQSRFIPDPEQLDAILLQQEFDPMAQHRDKSKLYNEINKHNKSITIPTDYNSFNRIAHFFKCKKPGDKFWTGVDKQYIIQSVTKVGREYQIVCTDMNQATQTFNFNYFSYRRLYKEQPRSFAKESQK